MILPGNPNRSEALRVARELGCEVRQKRGNSEYVVSHPLFMRPVIVNAGRKDASRALLVQLRHLAARLAERKTA